MKLTLLFLTSLAGLSYAGYPKFHGCLRVWKPWQYYDCVADCEDKDLGVCRGTLGHADETLKQHWQCQCHNYKRDEKTEDLPTTKEGQKAFFAQLAKDNGKEPFSDKMFEDLWAYAEKYDHTKGQMELHEFQEVTDILTERKNNWQG